jgi:hypothetical protein
MIWSWDEFGMRAAIRAVLASRRIHALLLLVVFLALGAVAPAGLADELWIAGLYDGGDAADVIRVLSLTEAAVETPDIVAKVRPCLAFSPATPAKGFPEVTSFGPPYLRSPPF